MFLELLTRLMFSVYSVKFDIFSKSVKINVFSTSVKKNKNVFITSVKTYFLLQRCFQVVVELCRGWRDGAIDISRTASPPKMFKRLKMLKMLKMLKRLTTSQCANYF